MQTLVVITVLAVLVIGRLHVGRLAADLLASLPADERSRIERAAGRSIV